MSKHKNKIKEQDLKSYNDYAAHLARINKLRVRACLEYPFVLLSNLFVVSGEIHKLNLTLAIVTSLISLLLNIYILIQLAVSLLPGFIGAETACKLSPYYNSLYKEDQKK